MASRWGKITGSALNDIVVKRGTDEKIGFYRLIAMRLGVPPDDENPMERGHRLEQEALERFSQETGKQVDGSLILWTREDDENIAVSPDGVISEEEAVEVKCLDSAQHIKAFLHKAVPSDYEFQVLQYFIVNDKLQKLYFVCYDPRFGMFGHSKLDYFVIEVNRVDVQENVEKYLAYQKEKLVKVYEIVNQLTF